MPNIMLGTLHSWASRDPAWNRFISSLSNYELGRRFWHQQDYQRSLEAVEQSIAVKLFPYTDPELQAQWQRSLIAPGYVFKRPKLELADALILMANSMYELGRRQSSIEHLYLSLEAIHLSAAMMHSGLDLVQEVLNHLEVLSQHVALAATDVLMRMTGSKVLDLMATYQIDCPMCVERRELLEAVLLRLQLPVRFAADGVTLEAAQHPFVGHAYSRQQGEGPNQFVRRLLFQLVGMIRLQLLADLDVPCAKWVTTHEGEGGNETGHHEASACTARYPWWLMQEGSEEADEGLAEARAAAAAASGVSSSSSPSSLSPAAGVDSLFTGNLRLDIPRLRVTLDWVTREGQAGEEDTSGGQAAGGMFDGEILQPLPPFSPPPVLFPSGWGGAIKGASSSQGALLARLAPLPFRPPRPEPRQCCPNFRKRVDVPKMRKLAQEFFHQERQRLLGLEDGYLDGYGDIDYEAQGGSGREHCTASSSEGSCQPHPRDPYASPSAGQYSRGDMGYEDVEIGGTGQDHGGHVGGSNGQGGHGSHYHQRGHDEDRRGLSDRQLQEQLARLLGGDEVQMPRDDPLVVLTLTGISVASVLLYLVFKHRKRLGRYLSGVTAGRTPPRAWVTPVGAPAGPGGQENIPSSAVRLANLREALAALSKAAASLGSGGEQPGSGSGAAAVAQAVTRVETALRLVRRGVGGGGEAAALLHKAEAALEQQRQKASPRHKGAGPATTSRQNGTTVDKTGSSGLASSHYHNSSNSNALLPGSCSGGVVPVAGSGSGVGVSAPRGSCGGSTSSTTSSGKVSTLTSCSSSRSTTSVGGVGGGEDGSTAGFLVQDQDVQIGAMAWLTRSLKRWWWFREPQSEIRPSPLTTVQPSPELANASGSKGGGKGPSASQRTMEAGKANATRSAATTPAAAPAPKQGGRSGHNTTAAPMHPSSSSLPQEPSPHLRVHPGAGVGEDNADDGAFYYWEPLPPEADDSGWQQPPGPARGRRVNNPSSLTQHQIPTAATASPSSHVDASHLPFQAPAKVLGSATTTLTEPPTIAKPSAIPDGVKPSITPSFKPPATPAPPVTTIPAPSSKQHLPSAVPVVIATAATPKAVVPPAPPPPPALRTQPAPQKPLAPVGKAASNSLPVPPPPPPQPQGKLTSSTTPKPAYPPPLKTDVMQLVKIGSSKDEAVLLARIVQPTTRPQAKHAPSAARDGSGTGGNESTLLSKAKPVKTSPAAPTAGVGKPTGPPSRQSRVSSSSSSHAVTPGGGSGSHANGTQAAPPPPPSFPASLDASPKLGLPPIGAASSGSLLDTTFKRVSVPGESPRAGLSAWLTGGSGPFSNGDASGGTKETSIMAGLGAWLPWQQPQQQVSSSPTKDAAASLFGSGAGLAFAAFQQQPSGGSAASHFDEAGSGMQQRFGSNVSSAPLRPTGSGGGATGLPLLFSGSSLWSTAAAAAAAVGPAGNSDGGGGGLFSHWGFSSGHSATSLLDSVPSLPSALPGSTITGGSSGSTWAPQPVSPTATSLSLQPSERQLPKSLPSDLDLGLGGGSNPDLHALDDWVTRVERLCQD